MNTQSQQNETSEAKKPQGFQIGNNANPEGGRARKNWRHFQTFKERLAHWLESKSLAEIVAIVTNEKKFGKLSAIDAMVAQRIAQACKADGGADMTIVLDRLMGKPPQAITGEDGKPLMPATDVNEIARRTAFLLSLPQAAIAQTIDHAPAIDAQPAKK